MRFGASSTGSARARGSIADSATVPLARYAASWLVGGAHGVRDLAGVHRLLVAHARVRVRARGALARAGTASPSKVSYSPVSSSSARRLRSPWRRRSPSPAPPTSSRRNRITVMLSRPPASLAAAISSRPACVEVVSALHHGPHADLVDHRRQAVRAEQVDVAAAGGERLDVDLHLALGAERARDHRALRVRLRLLLGELAAGDELADERVVAREPRQLAAAPQVGARVADVGDRDVRLADVGGRAGRAHAGGLLVAARAVVDACGWPPG